MTSRSVRLPSVNEERYPPYNKSRLWRKPMSHFLLPGMDSERVRYVRLPTSGDDGNGVKRQPVPAPQECVLERRRDGPQRPTAEAEDQASRVDETDGVEVLDYLSSDEDVVPPGRCAFVERTWFQAVTALIIFANATTTFVAMDNPRTKKWFFYPENAMLCFYIFEIAARMAALGKLYLCGSYSRVAWNLLDIIVVAAGVVDQWLQPMFHLGSESFATILKMMRLLRLLRILKIVRVFLDTDLSWTEQPIFQSFMGLVIIANSLSMGMEMDFPWKGWKWIEHTFLFIYVFELAVRVKNFGREFLRLRNPDFLWNVLDSFIVLSSVSDSWVVPLFEIIKKSLCGSQHHGSKNGMSLGKVMMLMRMLRLFRILRLVKLVKSVKPLFMLVTSMVSAFQGVVWVLVLTVVTLYGMGIMTTSLIGHKLAFPPGHEISDEVISPFASVAESMFTLFRVMSGASSGKESHAIDQILDTLPSLKFAFVFFMITSSWTLLSILTAVVSENMITSTQHQEHELKLQSEEDDHQEHVNMLKEIFEKIDMNGKGYIGRPDVEQYFSTAENRIATAKSCHVPVRHIQDVLCMLSDGKEDGKISVDTFVDHLVGASEEVSELSLTKLEIRIKLLLQHFEQRIGQVEKRLLSDADDCSPPKERQPLGVVSSRQEGSEGLPEQSVLACSRPWHDEKSAPCEEAREELHPFDKTRMHALDEFNRQLLHAQRTQADFLDTLERRWELMENMSHGVARSLEELRVGLEVGLLQHTKRVQTDFLESLERRWQLMEGLSRGVARSLQELHAGLDPSSLHISRGNVCVQPPECQRTSPQDVLQPAHLLRQSSVEQQ